MLKSTGYQKYVCESCAEVPDDLRSKLELYRSKLNELQTELINRNTVIDQLEKDLEDLEVELCTEQACNTLRKSGKKINQQKAIIDSGKYNANEQNGDLSSLRSQLREANEIAITRHMRIKEFENQQDNLKEEVQTRNNVNVENELSNVHINDQLRKEIVIQQELINNTEIAFNAQSKEQLFRNQRILGDSLKEAINSKHLEAEEMKPDVVDCIGFVKYYASNGDLVNGFSIWVWIQRRTIPENLC